ncbi:hypothetical protein [Rubrimonas cliftonensis]|uniref:Uncharacterized protein n=1 Tax=Rubrimonas cliftonensis TaxID=89524 RepID=A0A1H4EQR5_9RHOB|nr:hypothetical protein [Rubrimonas cliftonensis]SEA86622.1 hypothetical protein SAMN05444370_11511 [Rubrimonas cliftonensis]
MLDTACPFDRSYWGRIDAAITAWRRMALGRQVVVGVIMGFIVGALAPALLFTVIDLVEALVRWSVAPLARLEATWSMARMGELGRLSAVLTPALALLCRFMEPAPDADGT